MFPLNYLLIHLFSSIVEEHKAEHDPTNPRDFIDVYLTEMATDEEKYSVHELVR